MTTRMVHPENGFTHAYGYADIMRHKAMGWEVEDSATAPQAPEAIPPVPPAPSPEPVGPVAEKRPVGRPPKAG